MFGSDTEFGTVEGPAGAKTAQAEREFAEGVAEWEAHRCRLQPEKARIQQEISSYPTPIASCDEQFNHLLERRSQVRRELGRLMEAEKAS